MWLKDAVEQHNISSIIQKYQSAIHIVFARTCEAIIAL
jgi:hypothetical protein